MRKLVVILYVLPLFSCQHSVKINGRSLSDTLEALSKQYDFRPLNQTQTYAFINQYYLPRLDTLRTGRKIFIHPLCGIDFQERFEADKIRFEKLYAGDTTAIKKPPPTLTSIASDEKYNWNIKKLVNTKVIPDNPTEHYDANAAFDSVKAVAWRIKYGHGYMYISYPQYNSNTKRLVIREWLEDNTFCGTGRSKHFWFEKTSDGWKAY